MITRSQHKKSLKPSSMRREALKKNSRSQNYQEKGLVYVIVGLFGSVIFSALLLYMARLIQDNILTWDHFINESPMGIIGIIGTVLMVYGLSTYIYILSKNEPK
jgi:ABC-type antimicrobial peptide transport system permease subunit